MDANALTPHDLFDPTVIFEVPPFQRPYVWTEEDQWQPLWDDVRRLTEALLAMPDRRPGDTSVPSHFLGAVVLKQLPSEVGDPDRRWVIDGQQRLTTLQLLLDAAQRVVAELGDEDDSESLTDLVVNGGRRFAKSHKRFKVWPSRIDRAAFEHVMGTEAEVGPDLTESRVVQAHGFFRGEMKTWVTQAGSGEPALVRLRALVEVLQQRMRIVAIGLDPNDDDQLIFEILNDRGTPLLAADLIKNFVFQECEKLGADVDAWSDRFWLEFDGDWWRQEVAQGRSFRSRIDLFIQYWLTMRTRAEVPTDQVFAEFRRFAGERLTTVTAADALLSEFRRDADTYRNLADSDRDGARPTFYSRVIEALELGAFTPLLLWMISDNHEPPEDQVEVALDAIESWAVRRTLLRWTMKDVNRFVVSILQELDRHPLTEVGDATADYLRQQTADARTWPTDAEVLEALPTKKVYGSIKQARLRAILGAVETHLRNDQRTEATDLPPKLELEHIMPQGWRAHWGRGVVVDPDAVKARDAIIDTIGNLTLVTKRLNLELSNRPWTDAQAQKVAPSGKDAGVGKHSLLRRFSVLALNREIVDDHPKAWTDGDVEARSARLAGLITEIWPR